MVGDRYLLLRVEGHVLVPLVWDLRRPPEAIYAESGRSVAKVVEKVAEELVGAFNVEGISSAVRDAWDEAHPSMIWRTCPRARAQVEERLAELSLPHLPTCPN